MTDARTAYQEINLEIMPSVAHHFQAKQRQYRGGPAFQLLGIKGQFSDINRKFWKLYDALWLGNPIEGEQPEEICKDMIGHLLLTLWCLRQEAEREYTREDCTCPVDTEPGTYAGDCPFHEQADRILKEMVG